MKIEELTPKEFFIVQILSMVGAAFLGWGIVIKWGLTGTFFSVGLWFIIGVLWIIHGEHPRSNQKVSE